MTNLNLNKVLKSIIRTFFLFLANYKRKRSTETYADFRTDFLHDESGKMLWGEHLFLNIYDFWVIRRDRFLLGDYKKKNSLLKKIIRKKVRNNKELPTYKVLLRMIARENEQFNPIEFLHGDWEDYFHIIREWKKVCEKDFLFSHPHLREPKRHLKSKKYM